VGELFLVALYIVLLVKYGTTTLLWTAGILLFVFVIVWLDKGNKGKGRTGRTPERPRVRIDHPHYVSEDESECTICGRRIPAYAPICPNCGVRFNAARKDEEEWDEEFDEECAWDEEEGW